MRTRCVALAWIALEVFWARPFALGQGRDGTAGADASKRKDPALSDGLDRFLKQLSEGPESQRRAAADALLRAHEGYLQALSRQSHAASGAAKTQILSILSQCRAQAAEAEHRAGLSLRNRHALEQLKENRPELVSLAYSAEWKSRLKAAMAIRLLSVSEKLAEPLVQRLLSDDAPDVVIAAMSTTMRGQYRSDAIVDALVDKLVNASESDWRWIYVAGCPQQQILLGAAESLRVIHSARPAKALLCLLLKRWEYPNVFRDATLANALVATGEIRAIPELLKVLDDGEIIFTSRLASQPPVTYSRADCALVALLALTGQRIMDFEMVERGVRGVTLSGFYSDSQRREAISKFRIWWRDNKGRVPYAGIAPLGVPVQKP